MKFSALLSQKKRVEKKKKLSISIQADYFIFQFDYGNVRYSQSATIL
jgi:hypothetical protein